MSMSFVKKLLMQHEIYCALRTFDQTAACNLFVILTMVAYSQFSFCDIANDMLVLATVIFFALYYGQ